MILPSNGGSAVALLTMITAAAPACWPKIAFATRAQVPRSTTTIVSGGSAAAVVLGRVAAEAEHVRGVVRQCRCTSTLTVAGRPVAAMPLASIAVRSIRARERDVRTRERLGRVARGDADRAGRAVPGEPVMYGFGPAVAGRRRRR